MMKLQKIHQEADQGISEKPTCRIKKGAKPMLQILDSNTPTSHKFQILPSPLGRTDAASTGRANTPKKAKEDDKKRNCSFESGRERLKRHRVEVAKEVWIPDIWEQEDFLMDWIDSSDFDSALAPKGLISARAALVEEGRRARSSRLSVENTC